VTSKLPNDRLEAAMQQLHDAVEALEGKYILTMSIDGVLNSMQNVQGADAVTLLEEHLFVERQIA